MQQPLFQAIVIVQKLESTLFTLLIVYSKFKVMICCVKLLNSGINFFISTNNSIKNRKKHGKHFFLIIKDVALFDILYLKGEKFCYQQKNL